jgi:hypothetical protein
MAQGRLEKIAVWITIVQGLIWMRAGYGFIGKLMEPHLSMPGLSGIPRVQAILIIGVAAGAAHGILWTLVEKKILHRSYHEGSVNALPQGWSAILLSATMTIPLVLLPPLYGSLIGIRVVQSGQVIASCAVIAGAAIGHLLLYGVEVIDFSGIRRMIFPADSTSLWRALVMELTYAIVHFGSIVVIYRFVLKVYFGQLSEGIVVPTLLSAFLWLLGVTVFYWLKYPDSLVDDKTLEMRRVINGMMLMLTLQGGMLM